MTARESAICNTCTLDLVRRCYERAWWFRLIREPLVFGMRAMAWWHRIDPRDYQVRSDACYGCVRFAKTALLEESATFRWLNRWVDPRFNRIRNSLLLEGELEAAQDFAREATHPRDTQPGQAPDGPS